MPNFARLLAVSLRPRLVGGVIAAVLLLGTSGVALPRVEGSRLEWSQASAIQALPVLQSRVVQHADFKSRSLRRTLPHVDVPLATDASPSIAYAATSARLAVASPRPAAAVVSRGYDATAPPVS